MNLDRFAQVAFRAQLGLDLPVRWRCAQPVVWMGP
jgi:hypothetical protein